MTSQTNHALAFFYENALLVAECDAMPDHMLVCYRERDTKAMALAMQNANIRYGQGIAEEENMEKHPHFVAFWLPKTATPLYAPKDKDDGFEPEPQPTDAALYLQDKVKKKDITSFHATDFTDLHKKLPDALVAAVLHTSVSDSSFQRYN